MSAARIVSRSAQCRPLLGVQLRLQPTPSNLQPSMDLDDTTVESGTSGADQA